jgi:CRP-like cAMP-binding protein
VDLFRGFDASERADLAAKLRPRELSAGQVVVRQGDPGDFLYVLAEGILDVVIAHDGEPSIRDRLAPGEVFGEVSLLTGQPRTATISAAFDSRVYEIHREDLDPILRRRPEIVEGLAQVMAQRQATNARSGTRPEVVTAAVRDDLLARLRQLFGL